MDDWAPVKAADEDWTPVLKTDPMPDALQTTVPEAFLDRVRAGQALARITQSAIKEGGEGFAGSTPTGFSDETLGHLIDTGIFHDPAKSKPGPIQFLNEAALTPAAQAWQAITGAVSAGIHGAGGAMEQLVTEFGGSQGTANRAKNEIINAGNWAMIEGGMGRFSRPAAVDGAVTDQTIGGLPTPKDFSNAAQVLAPDSARPPIRLVSAGKDKYDILDHEGKVLASADIGIVNIDGKKLAQIDDINTPALESVSTQEDHDAVVKASRNALGTSQMREAMRQFREMHPDIEGFTGNRVSGARNAGLMGPENIQNVTVNLRRMWEEDGIHPAEAVHDAEQDAFLKHDITAKQEPVKVDPEDAAALETFGIKAHELSAAATEPGDIPLDVQPARPPGSLAATFQAASDKLFDLGRDVQMKLAPMATGTRDSMALVKDFANSVRRNRWDWNRIDDDIAKRFDPEARQRMWNASDEESLSLKLEEPASAREHQGLATLEPEQRAVVEEMHARAQNAWVRARDLGMVEGEGLPAYTPRMVFNIASASSKEGALPLNSIGGNLKTRTGNLLKRKYLEATETEAAAKAKYGDEAMLARDIRVLPLATSQLEDAIAGRSLINNIKDYGERTGTDTISEGSIPAGSDTKWFTLDHPAFKTWRPKFEEVDGKMQALKDSEGNVVFEQVPLYVHGDFEGPLRAVLSQKSGPLYQGLMAIKGKTMSLIMNSPMIHNAVEFGRAFPAAPMQVGTFKVYFEGNRVKNNVAMMHEAIDAGLVPIGKRFFNQDINSIMEAPDLTPGRSWTAKALGETVGRLPQAGMTADEVMSQVKSNIDNAGNFYHNTLLWDRIADLQMGLYSHFRSDMMAKGIDQQTSSRIAAHLANRYAGSLPKEAMSDASTKVANLLLFSRTFTMGNLGVLKDMFTGLPKDVLAQIERDAGTIDPAAAGYAKAMARRKAISTVVLDVGLMYAGNAIVQSAFNVMLGDRTLGEEAHGYLKRVRDQLQSGNVNPLSLLLNASPTAENEPGKSDRIYVGNAKDNTAIYARNPVGKIGEEFTGYLSGPLDMLRKKEGTIARPLMQIYSNDKGFGRKIYDPDADTPAKYAGNIWNIVKHVAASQLPVGQIGAFSDLVKGEGDPKVNTLQALGPFLGVTFAKGAPGGMDVGEMYHAKSQHEFAVNQAMPDIRRQILRGDLPGAQAKMNEIGIDASYQRWITKTTLNPRTRMGAKTMRDFYLYSTPAQKARMEGYLDRFGPQ